MRALLTAFLLSACAQSSGYRGAGPRGEWELLGTRQVSFAAEGDVIGAKHQGLFRAIKIDVDEGNLVMYNVRIVFGNGESYSPETRFEFREGTSSRTIDLPGAARVIRRIEFRYRSEIRRGRAVVRVWGATQRP